MNIEQNLESRKLIKRVSYFPCHTLSEIQNLYDILSHNVSPYPYSFTDSTYYVLCLKKNKVCMIENPEPQEFLPGSFNPN